MKHLVAKVCRFELIDPLKMADRPFYSNPANLYIEDVHDCMVSVSEIEYVRGSPIPSKTGHRHTFNLGLFKSIVELEPVAATPKCPLCGDTGKTDGALGFNGQGPCPRCTPVTEQPAATLSSGLAQTQQPYGGNPPEPKTWGQTPYVKSHE